MPFPRPWHSESQISGEGKFPEGRLLRECPCQSLQHWEGSCTHRQLSPLHPGSEAKVFGEDDSAPPLRDISDSLFEPTFAGSK